MRTRPSESPHFSDIEFLSVSHPEGTEKISLLARAIFASPLINLAGLNKGIRNMRDKFAATVGVSVR